MSWKIEKLNWFYKELENPKYWKSVNDISVWCEGSCCLRGGENDSTDLSNPIGSYEKNRNLALLLKEQLIWIYHMQLVYNI